MCLQKAHYLAEQLQSVPGVTLKFARPFFKEFVVQVPGRADRLLERLLRSAITPGCRWADGIANMENCISIAVTEKRTRQEIDALVSAFQAVGNA